jgi:zinc transport system substrate-binding protein
MALHVDTDRCRLCWLFLLIAVLALALGCSEKERGTQSATGTSRPRVYVVNYPLQYFAQRIGEDAVDVEFPAARGVDPAFWMPAADVVARFQSADIILLNGATYARWVPRVSLPPSKLVDTSAGFRDQYLSTESAVTHAHGPSGEHAHSGTAFTTWVDFSQAALQAQAVHDALLAAGVGPGDALGARNEALRDELLALDAELSRLAQGQAALPLLASHPVYGYLARRYGLNIRSVVWEPDTFPEERKWAELDHLRREHPAQWMIWESQPLPESVQRLEGMGIRSVVFDPCGNRPERGDFMDIMRTNVESLRRIFERPTE